MKKKLALLISGQPRNVEWTYKNGFKPNLFDCNPNWEIETYIHTWLSKDQLGKEIYSSAGYYASNPVPENIVDIIIECYQPKGFHVEEPIKFDEKNYNSYKAELINVNNSLSSMYSKLQLNTYLQSRQYLGHGDFYDYEMDSNLIMSTRFDWQLTAPLILDNFPTDAISVHKDVHPATNDAMQVGMAIGPLEYMWHWNNVFNDVENQFKKGVVFCDEQLYWASMKDKNIPINRCDMPYNIVRKPE